MANQHEKNKIASPRTAEAGFFGRLLVAIGTPSSVTEPHKMRSRWMAD